MCVYIYEPNCKNGTESHKPALVTGKILVSGKCEQSVPVCWMQLRRSKYKNDCHSKWAEKKSKLGFVWAVSLLNWIRKKKDSSNCESVV